MESTDFSLLRLQYEILNVSLESIASQSNLSLTILNELAKEEEWEHKWIDPDNPEPETDIESDFEDDELTTQTEIYIDRSKKRLAAYIIAKNILMAQKYLELEVSLVNKTIDHLDSLPNVTARDLKSVSSIFQNLLKGTPLQDILSMRNKEDESGIPLLVLRDLAGE